MCNNHQFYFKVICFSAIAPDVSTVNDNRPEEAVEEKGYISYLCLNVVAKAKSVDSLCGDRRNGKDQFYLYLLLPQSSASCISPPAHPASPECSVVGLSEY